LTKLSTSADPRGFALIMALLALMLLTFLGLTLSATTSTELQISTNYRWSQQALYNAEAGLEVGRALLATIGDGQLVLPVARAGTWDPDAFPPGFQIPASSKPVPRFAASRNFENFACDHWGNGAGYGAVLVDPNNPGTPFEDTNIVFGQRLNGAFTLWVRRDLITSGAGLTDNPVGESLVMTAEGSAPFAGVPGAFQRANRAIRRLESRITLREGCKPGGPQASQSGFSGCERLE
jgi:hypothetical protein